LKFSRLALTAAVLLMSCGDDPVEATLPPPDAGLPAPTPAPAPVVVTTVSDQVDPGTCPLGGNKFQYGIDDNANGVLDGSEVDSTQVVCNKDSFSKVLTGNLNLFTTADVALAQSYTGVIGNVYLDARLTPPAMTMEVILPKLTFISGSLTTTCGSAAKAIRLPALEQVGGRVTLGCGGAPLETVEAPALKTVGDIVTITGPVATLSLPELKDVNGLSLTSTAATTFPFPSLTRVRDGSFEVTDNGSLDECSVIARAHAIRGAQAIAGFMSISGNLACAAVTDVCPIVPVGADTDNFRLCYRRVASWSAAKTLCESLGAGWSLMYLSSEAERASLEGTAFSASSANTNSTWMGYFDTGHEGTWTWIQNIVGNTYAPQTTVDGLWHTAEPNGSFGENCAVLYPDRLRANDSTCSSVNPLAGCRRL
jgi:hypothetical protein